MKFDTSEAEPNNTAATAQVLTPVHHVIKGALPIGDLDVFKFTLTAPSKVEIETYNAWSTNYVSPTATASVSSLGLQCNAITRFPICRVQPAATTGVELRLPRWR